MHRVWQRKQLRKTSDLHFRASSVNAIQKSVLEGVLIVHINAAIKSTNKPRLTNYVKVTIDLFYEIEMFNILIEL